MGYKEIMSQVDKEQATKFMVLLKEQYALAGGNQWYQNFTSYVRQNLAAIGVVVESLSSSTADAVVTRMERKSRINL
jgi:hypothetical protein